MCERLKRTAVNDEIPESHPADDDIETAGLLSFLKPNLLAKTDNPAFTSSSPCLSHSSRPFVIGAVSQCFVVIFTISYESVPLYTAGALNTRKEEDAFVVVRRYVEASQGLRHTNTMPDVVNDLLTKKVYSDSKVLKYRFI